MLQFQCRICTVVPAVCTDTSGLCRVLGQGTPGWSSSISKGPYGGQRDQLVLTPSCAAAPSVPDSGMLPHLLLCSRINLLGGGWCSCGRHLELAPYNYGNPDPSSQGFSVCERGRELDVVVGKTETEWMDLCMNRWMDGLLLPPTADDPCFCS